MRTWQEMGRALYQADPVLAWAVLELIRKLSLVGKYARRRFGD